MNELTEALAMDAAGVARAVGVTVRTVRAWLTGERKPAERNRVKLARLVTAAHQEHSSAGHRWSASRDKALCAAKLALMSADQRAIHERRQEQMRAQFAAPAQRHAVWASYRQEPVFTDAAIEQARTELAARRAAAGPMPTGQELADLFTAAAYATGA
jgi:hypothetical protein